MSDYIDKSEISIEYKFFDGTHETEFYLNLNGNNILAFERNNGTYTVRWNLDELVLWLRNFIDNLADDPYPVAAEGEFAAEKDENAREFDSDDEEFDSYYDMLDDWNMRHRWHTASAGAVLPDVYFQQVGEVIEISWNNNGFEDEVLFKNISGGVRVDKEKFYSVVDLFLKEYADHWFK